MRPFKVSLVEKSEPATTVPGWVREELAAQGIDFVVRACAIPEDLAAHAGDALAKPLVNTSASIEHRTIRRIAFRILPLVFIIYLVAFIDRANVAYAKLTMAAELGFSEGVYGFGAGLFFLSYLVLEIPGALIVHRWGAPRWISRILASWGICPALVGFVHTANQFYAARLLLGLAEAGLVPSVLVYLHEWFPARFRARAMARFFIASPIVYRRINNVVRTKSRASLVADTSHDGGHSRRGRERHVRLTSATIRKPRKASGKPVDGMPLMTESKAFDPFLLDRQKLSEQIAHTIQQQISHGKLKPGDQLPPELELAMLLRVNRATVREAIHLLSERGLVERKNGRGTRIKAMPPANVGAAISRFFVSNNCSHRELHEFRSVFEPRVAAFAATNARPEDVERLGTALRELEDAWRTRDIDRLAAADAEFHFSLAVASHNALMLAVANGLKLVLERAMKSTHAAFHREESFRTHRLIYTAVARHDAGKAEQAMKHQLETSPFAEMEPTEIEPGEF